jgi:hypothetical protein
MQQQKSRLASCAGSSSLHDVSMACATFCRILRYLSTKPVRCIRTLLSLNLETQVVASQSDRAALATAAPVCGTCDCSDGSSISATPTSWLLCLLKGPLWLCASDMCVESVERAQGCCCFPMWSCCSTAWPTAAHHQPYCQAHLLIVT